MACLFCDICDRKVPSDIIYEDSKCLAFRDIDPGAPSHILVIPKKHLASLNDLTEDDSAIMGHLMICAAKIAATEGLSDSGYRLVVNCNKDGGQTVFHIHIHILGGRRLHWPPG